MNVAPTLDNAWLFMLFVVPGFISIHIYKLLMPTKDVDWKNSIIEATFYGALNFAISLPVIIPINNDRFITKHFGLYVSLMMVVLLITPIILPIIWSKILRNEKLMRKLQDPYPTAWDYFFSKRESLFALIHLKNGELIGGIYGENSYATSFPRHGDLYLEAVIKIDSDGNFDHIISGTKGLLISKGAYEYVEFFENQPDLGDINETK